jgi:hypothetical protein
MPNYCQNYVELFHDDSSMLTKVIDAANKNELFQQFVPMPEELRNTTSPSTLNSELVIKYGYDNWYDWAIANWGTKWEVVDPIVEGNGDSVTLTFDTAWSPPMAFYEALNKQGFIVDALYSEEGMGFAGHYTTEEGDNDIELEFRNTDFQETINEINDIKLKEYVQDLYDEYQEWTKENGEDDQA